MQEIEIPFEFRNTCYFCGEPRSYISPVTNDSLQLGVPTCSECDTNIEQLHYADLEEARDKIKERLIMENARILQIGAHWSETELKEAEFSGDLGRFGAAGWDAYKILYERVRFRGWAVTVDGLSISQYATNMSVEYDGMRFQSRSKMLDFVVDIYDFNRQFFERVLDLHGDDNIDLAVKYCLISSAKTSAEMDMEIADLEYSLNEMEEKKRRDYGLPEGAVVIDL